MPKVLVVGPRDLTADLDRTVLWADHVERIFAASAASALEVAHAFIPSLVVVDADTPSAHWSVVRPLRESAGTRRASIVAIRRASGPSKEELLTAGANLVLDAPVDGAVWNGRLQGLLVVPRRVRIRYPVWITSVAEKGIEAKSSKAAGLDISAQGMLLETTLPLKEGTLLEMELKLRENQEGFRATGVVARVHGKDSLQAGIRFANVPDSALSQIQEVQESTPEGNCGRYEVQGLIGEGAMGRVHRAFDPLARRAVAIKTLKSEYLHGTEAATYLERFRREAQAAAHLVHPNIVSILDVGPDYFVMELLEGMTLQRLLQERGKVPPSEACQILRPIAEALDYAHAAGTVHRDIKPANLMILVNGRPKVMDFGVAHLTSGSITAAGQFLGSPAYMAPEQMTLGAVTAQTDVYSLAVVAYELITGRKPLDAPTIPSLLYKVVNAPPDPPSTMNSLLPPRFDDLFRRALSKEASGRHHTACAFVDELEFGESPVRQSLPPPVFAPGVATSPPGVEDTVDLRARFRWTPAAGAVVLLLGIAAAVVSTRPGRPPGVSVTTDPPGAAVFVDGKRMGSAPILLRGIPPGPHSVKVESEGHNSSELRLEFPSEGPPAPLHFALQAVFAALELESDPSPARVRVDKTDLGPTPLSTKVPAGKHEILIERQGYESWKEEADLKAGETLQRSAHLRPLGTPATRRTHAGGWVRRGDMVELGPGVTPPLRLSGSLPPDARATHGGTVVIEITVTEEGVVLDPKVVTSAGDALDQAFLKVVPSWHYQPAESNGVQVRVRIREQHSFPASP